jgi:hypothetical protein
MRIRQEQPDLEIFRSVDIPEEESVEENSLTEIISELPASVSSRTLSWFAIMRRLIGKHRTPYLPA